VTVRVKICGITRVEDAQLAASCGAAAVGFNFWPDGPRYCSPAKAKEIADSLPPFVARVGVFVNSSADEIEELVQTVGLSAVQLHGHETPQECEQPSVPVIKAMQMTDDISASDFSPYDVAAFLLDAPSEGYGGSGRSFDWSVVAKLNVRRPVIIAGGMTASNVAQAIETAHPYGIDVASGVEVSPGIKDPDKLAAFFAAVRESE
jgi:phosphoribosylanthranilate isomerase